MKRGLIVILVLVLMLVPISIAEEYYLPGEVPLENPTSKAIDDSEYYTAPTPAEEKAIVKENYYRVNDLQKSALDACRRHDHETAISKLNEAFELADELAYINNAFKRLNELSKFWFVCASYQEEDDKRQYVLGAGNAIEASMPKAELYIDADKRRASQMFLVLGGLWEKMRYQARGMETKYDQKFTCETELYCLERSKELEHPQAEETLNKLASSEECKGFSAVAPEEFVPMRTEEKQEVIEELLEPEEEKVEEQIEGPAEQVPEAIVEEEPEVSKETAKISIFIFLVGIFAIIIIICIILLAAKKYHG